ncbi:MAG: hypothetical protein MZU95_16835 [Desulfomicrobium escambiense]|nr:hypothetical protein [Desulfomicrobium escambiense]
MFHRFHDPRREVVRKKLSGLGFAVRAVHISDNYLVSADITGEQAEMVADLLVQPVIEDRLINKPYSPPGFTYAVEIGFLPGVTDNIAHTVRESIEDLLKMRLDIEKSVFSTTTYFLTGDLTPRRHGEHLRRAAQPAYPEEEGPFRQPSSRGREDWGADLPVVSIAERPEADVVDLSVGDDELMQIGKEGIRDPDGAAGAAGARHAFHEDYPALFRRHGKEKSHGYRARVDRPDLERALQAHDLSPRMDDDIAGRDLQDATSAKPPCRMRREKGRRRLLRLRVRGQLRRHRV